MLLKCDNLIYTGFTVTSTVEQILPTPFYNAPLACDNPSTQIFTTGPNGASFAWTGPNGFSSNQQNPFVTEPGTYDVTVSKNGCVGTGSLEVEETIVELNPTATNDGPLTCNDNSVQLSATGPNNSSYSWTGPNDFSSTQENPTINAAGTYTVTVTKDGCTGQASTTVQTDIVELNPTANNDGPLTCNDNSVQLSATGPNNSSYSWIGPNDFSSTEQNPTVTQGGTYTVTVTQDNCTGQASTNVISNTDAPTATANANEDVLDCETGTIELFGSSNMTNVSYSWTGPNGYGSNQQNPIVNAAGVYTLTVTKNDTGCEATDEIMIAEGNCIYDLALIKILAPNQATVVSVGDVVSFIVKVTNQGQINSGAFTVVDRLPFGMSFVNADNGGIVNNSVVTWNLDDLAAGDFIELSISATVDALGNGKYVNWAEISQDSGDDEDSTPDANTGNGFTLPNDLVENHNDMMLDNSPNDEDDNDFEEIFIKRGIELESRVLLQGAMLNSDTDYMRSDLNDDDLIPMMEPYSSMSNFEHVGEGGGEMVMQGVFDVSGENAIVDWVLVELRDETNPAIVLETASGLLQADGDIVAVDGVSTIAFPSLEADYYQVCVRHRNHLAVMTQNAVYISDEGEPANVDFTSPEMDTYGNFAQNEITAGRMAMWAGATSGNNQIAFQGVGNDLGETFFSILEDPNNTNSDIGYISTGYHNGDIDMNCDAIYQGTDNDPNCIFFNVLSHPANFSTLPNFIIQGTLPE